MSVFAAQQFHDNTAYGIHITQAHINLKLYNAEHTTQVDEWKLLCVFCASPPRATSCAKKAVAFSRIIYVSYSYEPCVLLWFSFFSRACPRACLVAIFHSRGRPSSAMRFRFRSRFRSAQSINQSKVPTKPHTGKEKPHPSTATEV